MPISRHLWPHLLIVSALVVANLWLFQTQPLKADPLTDIYMLDVGQGDAILIRTSDEENILIDGGPTDSVISSLNQLLPPWDRDIDLMILTHAHADHATGLLSVVSQFPVHQFWYSGAGYDSNIYNQLLASISGRHIPTTLVAAGTKYNFATSSIRVISPAHTNPIDSDANNTSIVTIFQQDNFDLLLTGDMTSSIEERLTAAQAIPDVDVIKVPHHGSRGSSTDALLRAAAPEVGLVSTGKDNDYGHPHPEALARYTQRGIDLLRTDLMGTVHLLTDGITYKVAGR